MEIQVFEIELDEPKDKWGVGTVSEMWEKYPYLPTGSPPLDEKTMEIVKRAFYAGAADMFIRMGSMHMPKPCAEDLFQLSVEIIKFAEHVMSSGKVRTPTKKELYVGMQVCRPDDATKTGIITGISNPAISDTIYNIAWAGRGNQSGHYIEELGVVL